MPQPSLSRLWMAVVCLCLPVAPGFAHEAPAFDLSRWKLTLPTDLNGDGKADEVKDLSAYSNPPWFHRAPEGLVFRTVAGGARTSGNTAYSRSELREMAAGGKPAAWDCLLDTRSLTLEQSLLATTTAKPEVSIGQIHDARNDNLMLKYLGPAGANGQSDTGRIELLWNNASQREVLDPAYTLGEAMQVTFSVSRGTVRVTYRNLSSNTEKQINAQMAPASIVGACYFKVGVYVQACSKLDIDGKPNHACMKKGWAQKRYDSADAYAEVRIRHIRLD